MKVKSQSTRETRQCEAGSMAIEKAPGARELLRRPLAEVREVLDQVRAVCAVEPMTVETPERAMTIAERLGSRCTTR